MATLPNRKIKSVWPARLLVPSRVPRPTCGTRKRVSRVGLGTRLTGPHASSIAENSNCTSCKNKLYFKTVLSYVSGLWTAALELQELHKDTVSTQTLTRLLHTTQGIHILLELPYKFRGNSSSCNRRQGNKYSAKRITSLCSLFRFANPTVFTVW